MLILHSNGSMRMLRYHVLTVIGRGRHQCSRRSESQRSAELKDDAIGRPESLIYLELEPWQWKPFTVGMIIRYSVRDIDSCAQLAMPYV